MTPDEIMEMAREAGVWTEEDDWFKDTEFEDNWNPKIEAFAKLVAEKALTQPEQQRMAKRIEELEATLERQTARIIDLQTHIENFDGEDR